MPKKNPSWYVYILRCADRTFYTGITKDLGKRLKEHNSSARGAKYTRGRRPVRLVYFCRCRCRTAAQRKEYVLRKLSRRQKLTLIKRS